MSNPKQRAKFLLSMGKTEDQMAAWRFFEGKLLGSGIVLFVLGLYGAFNETIPRWIFVVSVFGGTALVFFGWYLRAHREAWDIAEPYLTDEERERLKRVVGDD